MPWTPTARQASRERASQAGEGQAVLIRCGVAGGIKHALVVAYVARHFGGKGTPGASMQVPLHTITCQDHHALVTATLGNQNHEVRAMLTRYNGTGEGQSMQLPLGAITTKDRFGLVMVHGKAHEISDIGMRMLTPGELFRAQGFPADYDISASSKTAQVRLVGNSVSPPVAAALVRANLGKQARRAA